MSRTAIPDPLVPRSSTAMRLLGLLLALLFAQPSWAVKFYTTGDTADVATATSQAVCLGGGGSDDEWADGWKYLLERSGGGDVVIIRADKSRGGYEPWLYDDPDGHGFRKINSVTTVLLTKAEDANRPDVVQEILNAELIFFAGGDQSVYIDWLRESKLLAAVEYALNVKKVPIGGTSAGMMILADIDFAAHYPSPSSKNGLVSSDDVLKDPTGIFVDLDRTVLIPPFMNKIVTDAHLTQRARQGRLVGFMARAVYNNYGDVFYNNVKGIGVDAGTAVCYDANGYAKVFGTGHAFFLQGNKPIERIEPGAPLNWYADGKALKTYKIQGYNSETRPSGDPAAGFDLRSWNGFGGGEEFWWVNGSDPTHPSLGMD